MVPRALVGSYSNMTAAEVRTEIESMRPTMPPVPQGQPVPESIRLRWHKFWSLHILLHDLRAAEKFELPEEGQPETPGESAEGSGNG
jgi:hypothetical protein